MKRDISNDEAWQEKVDELTAKNAAILRGKLQGGDPATISAISGALCVALADDAFVDKLARQAAIGPLLTGDMIVKVVDKAIRDAAEAEALREVEQMEQERQESGDDNRIARAEAGSDLA